MNFCCQSAQIRFEARKTYGEFLVSGFVPAVGEVWFFSGFNLAHREDYSDVAEVMVIVSKAIAGMGISNIKISGYRCIHFCDQCGTNLKSFYGNEGGSLLDQPYVDEMRKNT